LCHPPPAPLNSRGFPLCPALPRRAQLPAWPQSSGQSHPVFGLFHPLGCGVGILCSFRLSVYRLGCTHSHVPYPWFGLGLYSPFGRHVNP
jgi:hypothetical protein